MYYGWLIVSAAFVMLFFSTGIGFYTFSVFLIPLERSFDASRTAITGVNSVVAIMGGLAGPATGALLHSLGPRIVIGGGAILTGGAFLLLSKSTELWHLYVLGIFLGTGLSATTLIPAQTLVANWFAKKRGIAMGITMIGVAVGGIVFSPLAHHLIERFDWRQTYVLFGLAIPVVIVPLAVLVIRRSPEELGLRDAGEVADGTPDSERLGLTVAESLRTVSFWLLFSIQFFMTMGIAIVTAHIVGIVTASGFGAAVGDTTARLEGARTTSYFLAASIPGRILCGSLAERFSKRGVMAAAYVVLIASGLTLMRLEGFGSLYAFVTLYGLGLGVLVVFPLLVADNFGLKAFSTLIGIMGVPFTFGAALGFVSAAKLFDVSGSYSSVLSMQMSLFAICAVLALLAKPPRKAADSA
jgi:MFS family permease